MACDQTHIDGFRHTRIDFCMHAVSGTGGQIGVPMLPDGCNFDQVLPALALDSPGTQLSWALFCCGVVSCFLGEPNHDSLTLEH